MNTTDNRQLEANLSNIKQTRPSILYLDETSAYTRKKWDKIDAIALTLIPDTTFLLRETKEKQERFARNLYDFAQVIHAEGIKLRTAQVNKAVFGDTD